MPRGTYRFLIDCLLPSRRVIFLTSKPLFCATNSSHTGTRCGHWSEKTFVDEVMTGYSEEVRGFLGSYCLRCRAWHFAISLTDVSMRGHARCNTAIVFTAAIECRLLNMYDIYNTTNNAALLQTAAIYCTSRYVHNHSSRVNVATSNAPFAAMNWAAQLH